MNANVDSRRFPVSHIFWCHMFTIFLGDSLKGHNLCPVSSSQLNSWMFLGMSPWDYRLGEEISFLFFSKPVDFFAFFRFFFKLPRWMGVEVSEQCAVTGMLNITLISFRVVDQIAESRKVVWSYDKSDLRKAMKDVFWNRLASLLEVGGAKTVSMFVFWFRVDFFGCLVFWNEYLSQCCNDMCSMYYYDQSQISCLYRWS